MRLSAALYADTYQVISQILKIEKTDVLFSSCVTFEPALFISKAGLFILAQNRPKVYIVRENSDHERKINISAEVAISCKIYDM